MNVGFIADISRRQLIETICIAYKPILRRHTIFAEHSTGIWIENASGLKVEKLHPASVGGAEQLRQMIECGRMHMLFAFFDPESVDTIRYSVEECLRACDQFQIPLSLNMATSELLILDLAQEMEKD